mmetsp:Transcript_11583/g.13735  ORF Transcript_11583/g.13735 Transcript_11583/m.13735 type:complete len:316 (+) Transcript_11583:230-1177(+)|eukprot:CAMPEP_0197843572 /NCGR_PEP_ID=MMETSP1438-20131217/447_1 /TAXON_ID=1461541 /ORGANISM="Pterosperma sp., Strain CCMP1384" /LENGTH=315 /DNA_ID=CAMNT_0043453787 /DNA_START=218 /DNA_END=1165 /DNA_ORIENTATION=+
MSATAAKSCSARLEVVKVHSRQSEYSTLQRSCLKITKCKSSISRAKSVFAVGSLKHQAAQSCEANRATWLNRTIGASRLVQCNHSGGQQSRHRSVLCRAADDLEKAAAAAQSAIPLPEGATPEDMKAFYDLLQSATADELEKRVNTLVESGKLNEGLLGVAFAALEKAKQHAEEEPHVVQSLEQVCSFLLHVYQNTNMPPSLALVETIVGGMGECTNAEEATEKAAAIMTEAFAEGKELTCEIFVADVAEYLKKMDEQDKEMAENFEVQDDQLGEEERKYYAAIKEERKTAKDQMKAVYEMGKAFNEGIGEMGRS